MHYKQHVHYIKMEKIKSTYKDLTKSIKNELVHLKEKKNKLVTDVNLIKQPISIPHSAERVLLDIGGHHYSTSMATLKSVPGSYFDRVFSAGSYKDLLNRDGRYFLDRDGILFRYVLNCLREPNDFSLTIKNKQDLEDLRVEAQFYGIEDKMFTNSVFIPDVLNWLDEKKLKIVAFSTEHSNRFPATNVLDYSRTYWLSLPGTITDQWLTFDFGMEAFITKIAVKVDNFECTVKDFMLQNNENDDYKDDNGWVTMKEFQAKCGNNCTEDQYFEGFEFRGRYMRMFCKNNWGPGGGNFILITNIKFYGALIE